MPSSSRTIRAAAITLALLLASPMAAGDDPERLFQRGVEAYDRGDVAAAIGAFRQAGEQGHVPAQVRLGYVLDISGQDAAAADWFRKAAEQGSAEGSFWLARLYATGEHGEQDPVAALQYFRRASEGGYGQATVVLARAHEQGGLGLEVDPERALELWRRAAEQGEVEAARRLARAYANGELGLGVDAERAAAWDERRKVLGRVDDATAEEAGDAQ